MRASLSAVVTALRARHAGEQAGTQVGAPVPDGAWVVLPILRARVTYISAPNPEAPMRRVPPDLRGIPQSWRERRWRRRPTGPTRRRTPGTTEARCARPHHCLRVLPRWLAPRDPARVAFLSRWRPTDQRVRLRAVAPSAPTRRERLAPDSRPGQSRHSSGSLSPRRSYDVHRRNSPESNKPAIARSIEAIGHGISRTASSGALELK